MRDSTHTPLGFVRDRSEKNGRAHSRSKATRPRGARRDLCTVAALAGCLLLAPSAFAGGGLSGLCPDGPCVELVAVAINGNPITPTSNVTVQPGDEIEANLFVSGWGEEVGLLRTFETRIDWQTAAGSGIRGTVTPRGWDAPLQGDDCNATADCPPGSFCEFHNCIGPNHDPNRAVLIDASRDDFFAPPTNVFLLAFLDDNLDYVLQAGAALSQESAPDLGVPRYTGTFFLQASPFACGDFATFALVQTYLGDAATPTGETVPATVPLTVEVGICDCNSNTIDDLEEVASGEVTDCNTNNVPDECEADCQPNGIADECDISEGTSLDCDLDVIPDECEVATDCNENEIRDECEVVGPNPFDCNGNGVPDDCDGGTDCNANGTLDACDLDNDSSLDCQSNGVPDECDIDSGYSRDDDDNGVPDECETLCAQSTCGPGSCVSLKAVAINGYAIEPTNNVIAARGDVIETEVWLSCWGADVGLLRAYQATLKGRDGVTSGDAGLVLPIGWDAPLDVVPCDSSLGCPMGTECISSRCTRRTHDPDLGAFIATARTDFVSFGLMALTFVRTADLDYSFVSAVTSVTGATDVGTPAYGGTLLLAVSLDACGEFAFDFGTNTARPGGSPTVFITPDHIPIVPNTQPLYIQTHDCDCNDNGILDAEDIAAGTEEDCDQNGTPDRCDLASGEVGDMDNDGIIDPCDDFIPIPTVSEWGLATLALLLLVVAKLRFGRTPRRAARRQNERKSPAGRPVSE